MTTMIKPPPAADAERLLHALTGSADLLLVDGNPFLLIPVTDRQLDALAELGAEAEDLEPEEDCDRDSEDEVRPGELHSHRSTGLLRAAEEHGPALLRLFHRPAGGASATEGNSAPGWRGGPVARGERFHGVDPQGRPGFWQATSTLRVVTGGSVEP